MGFGFNSVIFFIKNNNLKTLAVLVFVTQSSWKVI